MDLNTVQMFVGVVRAGSLSAASATLDIPLPTLSRRVRELEKHLGVQLLDRSVRGVHLTDAGVRLFEHAVTSVDWLAEAEDAVRNDQAQLSGRLRLSIPPAFDPWWSMLRDFQRQHPGIRLSVHSTERRLDLVQDEIDVALRIGELVDENVVARRLLSYQHVIVGTPELLSRLGTPASPQDLLRFPCALWAGAAKGRTGWRLDGAMIEPVAALVTNDYQHLRAIGEAGDALVDLPPFLARDGLRSGRLVRVLPQHCMPSYTVMLIHPFHRHPSSVVKAYLDFCQANVHRHLAMDGDKPSHDEAVGLR
jgi:DNA-binding transcriptional LysR family regulator